MSEMHIFPKCTPESAGIPSAAIEKYLRAITDNDLYMHGLMIVRNGKCLHETYWKPFDENFRHRLYSCSKSFVAVAVGLAIEQGYFTLESKCVDFFPEYLPENVHPYLAQMTVRDLLRMASCWTAGSNYSPSDPDWIGTFFTDEVSHVPGTVFNYCTSGTTMLCAIIRRTTGKDFMELLRPVFDKIGVSKDAFCVQAPMGKNGHFEWGGSGVVMTMRDFAKFANLCMHMGEHEGEYILPFDYMCEATSAQIDNSLHSGDMDTMLGYGYQFWMARHGGFAFYGMGGQYAICIPEKDLLVVTTGYEELQKTDRLEIFRALWREIWPCISDEPLPEDKAAQQSLAEFSESIVLPHAPGKAHSAMEKEIDRQVYIMNENPMGMKRMRFSFRGESIVWEYENATGEHALVLGLGRNEQQAFPERYCAVQIDRQAEKGYNCFASAGWTSEDTIGVHVHVADDYLGQLRMKICFKGDSVNLLGFKHAEWFMDEFVGNATGHRKGE